jgi:hypothetical protein
VIRKLKLDEKNNLNEFLKTACYEIKGDTKIILNINEIFDKCSNNITATISKDHFITQILPFLEYDGFINIEKDNFTVTLDGIYYISLTYSIPEIILGVLSKRESIFYMKKILEKIRNLSKNHKSIEVNKVRECFRILDDMSFQHLIEQLSKLGYIQVTDNIIDLLLNCK